MSVGHCHTGLDGTDDDEQEPSEGKAAVHISKQQVLFGDAPMQQAFAESLPDGRQEAPAPDILADYGTLQFVETMYPPPVFDN